MTRPRAVERHETMDIFRVKAYPPPLDEGTTLYSSGISYQAAEDLLDTLVSAGVATGGQVEMYVDGIGWCVESEAVNY